MVLSGPGGVWDVPRDCKRVTRDRVDPGGALATDGGCWCSLMHLRVKRTEPESEFGCTGVSLPWVLSMGDGQCVHCMGERPSREKHAIILTESILVHCPVNMQKDLRK